MSRVIPLPLALSVALVVLACGTATVPPDTSPTPPPATVKPATPTADTASPAAKAGRAWVAWRQSGDRTLTAALIAQEPGQDAPRVLMERKGAALVSHGDSVWALSAAVTKRAIKPCDDDDEAVFTDLRIGALDGAAAGKTIVLADDTNRPSVGDNAIHVEWLHLRAQMGPLLYLHHWTNSDICPVPATGASFDVYTVVDLRTGARRDPMELLDDKERAAASVEASPAAVKGVQEQFPDAPLAEIQKVLALSDVAFAWQDDGTLGATYEVYGESTHFGELVDEVGGAGEDVAAKTLPASLAPHASPAPAAVVAFWTAETSEGRGYSPLTGAAFEAAKTWFAAGD